MDSDWIEREAADWLARRDGDHWTAADEAAFRAWQRQSTAHRVAVIRLRAIWRHGDRLQALGAGVPRGTVPPTGRWQRTLFPVRAARTTPIDGGMPDSRGRSLPLPIFTPKARRHWRLATAASVVLAIGAGLTGSLWQLRDADTYRTTVGGIQTVPLDDGSRVILNTDSRIRLDWSQRERLIELARGEAFFEVTKDAARPFVVRAGDTRVVAVGTRFSVRRDGDGVRVVVTQGRVRVENLQQRTPATELAAGDIARAGATGVLVRNASIARAETQLSWRSGYLTFDDTRLADAVAEFNRYNRRQLVITDPALADLPIGGNLRATNVEAFVHALERGFPVRATVQGERIMLDSRQ